MKIAKGTLIYKHFVHSTEHPIVQLVDQIVESFEYNKYTLGVLSTYLKPLIESAIQYFIKNLNYIVKLTETTHSSKTIYQIGAIP